MRRLQRILLLVALLLANTAPARSLEELEKTLARTPPVSTGFVEYRFSHVLKKPLRTSGTLEYRADGVLARSVESPFRELTEVEDGTVRITRGDKPTRRLSLDRAPQLRLLLGSFRALLDGRLTPLERDFQVTLAEQGDQWRLTLVPRDPGMRRHLRSIDVYGAGDRPRCIEAVEADGDAAFTLLGDVSDMASPSRTQLEERCRVSMTGSPQ